MNWQDVAKEFGYGTLWDIDAQPDATQRMAEEIVRLREENKTLAYRLHCNSGDHRQFAQEMSSKIARSESKRAKLREALEVYKHLMPERFYAPAGMSEDERVAYLKEHPELVARAYGGTLAMEALAVDAAEDLK